MPRDHQEILLSSYEPVARAVATVNGAGDTGILMILGAFSMIDAVLFVLWGLM